MYTFEQSKYNCIIEQPAKIKWSLMASHSFQITEEQRVLWWWQWVSSVGITTVITKDLITNENIHLAAGRLFQSTTTKANVYSTQQMSSEHITIHPRDAHFSHCTALILWIRKHAFYFWLVSIQIKPLTNIKEFNWCTEHHVTSWLANRHRCLMAIFGSGCTERAHYPPSAQPNFSCSYRPHL